jgi:hypothetical protein
MVASRVFSQTVNGSVHLFSTAFTILPLLCRCNAVTHPLTGVTPKAYVKLAQVLSTPFQVTCPPVSSLLNEICRCILLLI